MLSSVGTQPLSLSAPASVSPVHNILKAHAFSKTHHQPQSTLVSSSNHGIPPSCASSEPRLVYCKGTPVSIDPDLIPDHTAQRDSTRSLHGGRSRLAAIREEISSPVRAIGANHLSSTCTGNRAHVRTPSPIQLVANSAGQRITYRGGKDDRHLAPNTHRSDPSQLSHGSIQDTTFCTSEAIQGFGLLFVLQFTGEKNRIAVQAVSDNSNRLIGRTPSEILSLECFTSIIKESQRIEFIEQINLIQCGENDIITNRFEAFRVSMNTSEDELRHFWCVMHQPDKNSTSIICEFELHESEHTVGYQGLPPLHFPSNTMAGTASAEDHAQNMQPQERSLKSRRSGGRRKCRSVAMDTLNALSRVQDRLAAAPDVGSLLNVAIDTVKDLTGFHRVMMYRFDQDSNARVVTEHADAKATTGAYMGRIFAASEFARESGESYSLNKLRILYDRDISSARLVCSASQAFRHPLDLTYSYLRAMSDDRLKSLANLAVRSSISISVSAFNRLWGLVVCHSYGLQGMRTSFPIRRMCYLLSDVISKSIERLSYVSQLKAKNLINTLSASRNSSGYLGTSLAPLLKLLRADSGILSVSNTTQVFGSFQQPQEALALLAYLRIKTVPSVLTSTNVKQDFADLRCPFDLHSLGGVLVVPLSNEVKDFVVFFRNPQFKELRRSSDPDATPKDNGTESFSELRKKTGSRCEPVVDCGDWTEEDVEIALVFAFVYAKLISIWGQDEAALRSSRLTQLLLTNTAHEIRTPLNAVINYLELALEGSLDKETRKSLEKSQQTSKSLLRFVHELLKLITGDGFGR